MASFQAKTGWDRLRVIQKKNLSFRFIPSRSGIWNSKKLAKKCKNLKDIIMASFQAKTVRDRLRMREKKNYCFDPFQPDPEQGIPKKE